MTDLNREELLIWFDEIKSNLQDDGTWGRSLCLERDEQAHNQIRKLIQRKVSREFVEKWAKALKTEILVDLEWNTKVDIVLIVNCIKGVLNDLGFEMED